MMARLAIDGGRPVAESMIGYGRQLVDADDVEEVVNVLRSDYLTCGPVTERFEVELCKYTGARYATAVANGTAALHVACMAAGIGPGDEVIVSSMTFAASGNCVLYCGATPVFADIDEATWNISPESVASLIGPRTKAVIAVDFGGVHVASDALRKLCDENSLVLIEDAAHAIGTSYNGRKVGSIADITCFSFHPVKTITSGEGGAVLTSDPSLAKEIELFAKHGITRAQELMREPLVGGWHYEMLRLGYNYRMSEIQAALASSQLKKLDRFAETRRRIVSVYDEAFRDVAGISFQEDSSPEDTVRHLYVLRFDENELGLTRRWVYDALKAENIGVNVHYMPVYMLPFYVDSGFKPGVCPNAEQYYKEAVTIPLHPGLSEQNVADVMGAVMKVVGSSCRSDRRGV